MSVPLDPRGGLVRGVRAAVLTTPTVGAAVLAHATVDGCGSLLTIGVAAGLCWPAAVAVLGARRRLPALVLWLLAAQGLTHLLLESMCPDVVSGRAGLGAHLAASLTVPMLLAHAGAVLATAVLLGRADAGLWTAYAVVRAGARALRTVRGLPRPVVTPTFVRLLVRAHDLPVPRRHHEVAATRRRGPPLLLAR